MWNANFWVHATPPESENEVNPDVSTSLDSEMPSRLVKNTPGCVCMGHGDMALGTTYSSAPIPLWHRFPAMT